MNYNKIIEKLTKIEEKNILERYFHPEYITDDESHELSVEAAKQAMNANISYPKLIKNIINDNSIISGELDIAVILREYCKQGKVTVEEVEEAAKAWCKNMYINVKECIENIMAIYVEEIAEYREIR